MRTRKALLNFIFSFVRNFIGIVLGLVTTPIVLKYLGEERFGAFRILLDWLSHLGVLEFGLYSASLALMAKSATEGRSAMRSTLRLIFRNYCFVFVLQLTAYGVLAVFIEKLIPVSEDMRWELRVSTLIMAISLFFLISQIFKAYLESLQKGYVVSVVLMIFNISNLCFSTVGAIYGYGLQGQAIAYVLSLFISLLIFAFLSKKIWRDLFSSSSSQEDVLILKKQRWSHFLNEVCGRIALLSDNIIVSLFMGPQVVTAFFITQKASSMVQQQLQHVSNSSWAALGELYYQKKYEVFNQRVLELTEVIAFFSGVTLSVACILNPSFVYLWTGEATFSGLWVSNFTMINAGFFSILSLWSWCFTATNMTHKLIPVSIVQSVVNLAASIVLTKTVGVIGPLLGTFAGFVLVSVVWKSILLKSVFKFNLKQLTFAWIVPFLPPLGLTLALIRLFGTPQIQSWWSLILWGVSLTLLIFLICGLVLLRKTTRNLIYQKLKNLKK